MEALCDACFTSDSDAFLFGARTVYRDICLSDGGYVVCYEMTDIERNLGFGRNSLITLGVLLGSDYSSGVHGLGPESACLLVKSVGDSVVLQRMASEGLSFAKKTKSCKRKGQNMNQNQGDNGTASDLQSDDQFLQVINAYLKPKFHPPDSDAVQRVLGTYPFNRIQLRDECSKFFDWSREKTDEYILPKIAERDLRRYANLRSTSSELGLKLSMDEMPVKCPISSILKQRKFQGMDYYEVSWEEMHELKSSAVPADLVRSACPEKVREFEERGAQVKKAKECRPRPKKSDNKTPMTDTELRLQELLAEIEQQQKTPIKVANLYGVTESMQADTRALASLQAKSPSNSTDTHLATATSQAETHVLDCNITLCLPAAEVIDLVSPSPSVCARRVSESQRVDVQHIDVVELSESENEFSPDHARRARELRSFIAKVRND